MICSSNVFFINNPDPNPEKKIGSTTLQICCIKVTKGVQFQAVKSGNLPDTVIPTDEEFKTVRKKVAKPPKEETVQKKLERSRFVIS
jgi:hypothetical protein